MAHLLSVQGLVTTFRNEGKEFNAIEGVNLHVDRGEIVGIVGESGSGKSVTMLSVLQLIASPGRVAGGEVYLEGKKIRVHNTIRAKRYGFAYITKDRKSLGLFLKQDVKTNIAAASEENYKRFGLVSYIKIVENAKRYVEASVSSARRLPRR